MTQISNLYAEKIYSEHPIVLWSLDDQADYITLISEEQRDISTEWTTSGCVVTNESSYVGQPFENSFTTKVNGNVPSGETNELILVSPNLTNFTYLNASAETFCVGSYLYTDSAFIDSIFIGYEYTDPYTLETIQEFKEYPTFLLERWGFISATFEMPDVNADMRAVIKIVTFSGGPDNTYYQFYINGITVGQWSENFNAVSLGITPINFPETIALEEDLCIANDAYGLAENNAYSIVVDNFLSARNTSTPLIYGSSNVTKLLPHSGPSLVVPGQGFLNKAGQYSEYTVEFWTRIDSTAIVPRRIFGPIASSDGLYVESGFLTLVIGEKFASYYVGEWYRPMLIHIRVIRNNISVLINGDQVINLNIQTDELVLPEILDEYGKEQDWLGFYAYQDVLSVELDCIAIYSYQVPVTVAKRRWVYGQGVASQESINSSYNGSSAFIDYSFADYTTNYIYPDFAKWEQASFDNVITNSTSITMPQYSLPDIFLDTKTIEQWYSDCKDIQDEENKYITFRPNENWNNEDAYINFPRFNLLGDQIHSIYGVFEINDDDESVQILFKIYNTLTGNYFSVRKDGPNIDYYLYFNGIEEEFYQEVDFAIDEKFAVGINVQSLISYYGGNIAAFFGNQNGLKMYVGGDESGNTFTGKIYSIGIATDYNTEQISSHFETNGIVIFTDADELLEHTASYTLIPLDSYDTFFLDIGAAGFWEDYLPMSYFGQYVLNDIGQKEYDLDFIQFNIGITKDSPVDCSLTFQYIEEGANAPQNNFTITKSADLNGVIDLNNEEDWLITKYEVYDNSLIYPNYNIDFNSIAIVYRLDFNVRGIISKPINVKKLELSSQALNNNSFNPIGTRFGVDLFPYKRSGLYYDYKSKNPFSIYKGSTPYLYLTAKSGIEIRGDFNGVVSRGISIPINRSLATQNNISSIQMWLRYNEEQFPDEEIELFEINYREDLIKFYMKSNSSNRNRATVYGIKQSDGRIFDGGVFYWNGVLVKDPVITTQEWGVLGIGFVPSLIFDSYLGSINLVGPVMFNNIGVYKETDLQKLQSSENRKWVRVLTDGVVYFDWEFWYNAYTWEGVLVTTGNTFFGVNPQVVYNTYIGTNKIVIDDDNGLLVESDTINSYKAITWQTNVETPV